MYTEDQLITVAEACEFLRLGKTKVYELINEGSLECVHFGRAVRTSRKACDDFLERQSRLQRFSGKL